MPRDRDDEEQIPTVLCKPYLIEYATLDDRLRASMDAPDAVANLAAERLPTYERLAQQQFLECLDAMQWGAKRSESQAAARALFDRLFWSWRDESLRIVELDWPSPPFGLDLAWSPGTLAMFAELWDALAPMWPTLRPAFDRALSEGELVGRFEDFAAYARAWGDILRHGASDGSLGLVVVRFDSQT
jgi:hypothetical protein